LYNLIILQFFANDSLCTDSLYGIAGVLVLYTGYLRVTEYGKGWDFYSHEPIFWVKMLLFAIMGSSSFFPTTKIIQRAIQTKNASDGKEGALPPEPMSEKLAARMVKVINGELLVSQK
jgi:putative membrane protein